MQRVITVIFKIFKKVINIFLSIFEIIISKYLFYTNNIKVSNFSTQGIPHVSMAIGSKCFIGDGFKMNNGLRGNPIGRTQKCIFFINKNAELIIGNNVGISSTALIAHEKIVIEDNVKIGGGVCIYDTDFHSLDSESRKISVSDILNKINRPVLINNSPVVFIKVCGKEG